MTINPSNKINEMNIHQPIAGVAYSHSIAMIPFLTPRKMPNLVAHFKCGRYWSQGHHVKRLVAHEEVTPSTHSALQSLRHLTPRSTFAS